MRQESITILTGNSDTITNGEPKDVNQVVNLSVAIYCSVNTVAGVLKLQASNDAANIQPRTLFVPTNWVDIPNATATITAGASALIKIDNCSFGFIRAVWTKDGGGTTGNLTAQMGAVGV